MQRGEQSHAPPCMPKTIFTEFNEITELQQDIMRFIDMWVRTKKTPIPMKEVLEGMKKSGVGWTLTRYNLYVLINKGYIRRAVTMSNTTKFVQLRRV